MWKLPDSDRPCAWLCCTCCPSRERKGCNCGAAGEVLQMLLLITLTAVSTMADKHSIKCSHRQSLDFLYSDVRNAVLSLQSMLLLDKKCYGCMPLFTPLSGQWSFLPLPLLSSLTTLLMCLPHVAERDTVDPSQPDPAAVRKRLGAVLSFNL